MNIYTLPDLQDAFQRKAKLKYVFFWGHTPKQKRHCGQSRVQPMVSRSV